MIEDGNPPAEAVVSFGPFRLIVAERRLERDGVLLQIGARALDLLIVLVGRAGEVVGKRELVARVWPDVTVDEGSLRFHMAALRKLLGDGQAGARYVVTLMGRGYCFVAPVSRSDLPPAPVNERLAPDSIHNLPARLARMAGRDETVPEIVEQLAVHRIVTVVGAGGVGKTTIAVAAAHDFLEAYSGSALFVDLALISDPRMVAMSLASMLGLSVHSDDPAPYLISYLRDRRLLLILDNCEHLIEAAASLAELIFMAASQLHILATSREAMRIEGEHVYRLDPLACPPDDPNLTAAMARTFPAAEVFIERAAATGAAHLSDSDSAIVASICRKLDGIPLAIELTAGRVAAYGFRQTAELLDRRLGLLWEGRRTAPPRQQTLRATLDWSYGLLTDLERTVLRGIAAFVGQFTLDAALSVVSCATLDERSVVGAIDNLVAKSMIATQPAGAMMRYRLLETTRAYVCDLTTDDPELTECRARHAVYYRQWLEGDALDWPILSNASERALHLAKLANVRAALEWSLAPNGTPETSGTTSIGIQLAAAAATVFWGMSLASECVHWCERAILALDDAMRGSREEMRLQAMLGMSLLYTRGANDAAGIAVHRGLAIAETLGDGSDRLLPTSPLEVFYIYKGNYKTALYYSRLAVAIAEASKDLIAAATVRAGLGLALYHTGDFGGAGPELEAALRLGPAPRRISTTHFNDGFYVSASCTMAKTLWMRGFPVQAVKQIERTVEEFSGRDLPVPLSNAVGSAIMMSLWTGDLKSAEANIDWYITFAETNGFGPQVEFGRGYRGALAIQRGDTKSGVDLLLACIEKLSAARVEMLTSIYSIPLVQGLAAEGRFDEGLALIDRTAHWVDRSGEACYLPEILRVRGDILLEMHGHVGGEEAEACFVQSLDISRSQGALSWELRTATSFAKLRRNQGRIDTARGILAPVYQRFTEGFDTADLIAAKQLLEG